MRTPVLVGVGQFTDRLGEPAYRAASPVEIAAEAARRAVADAASAALLGRIDVIATTRTFEDSMPGAAPFGKSDNFPRSVARRLGIDPPRAHWTIAGGNTPQKLVNAYAGALARGEAEAVLLCGGEAISTVRHHLTNGKKLDWSESVGGAVHDEGWGTHGMITRYAMMHRIVGAPAGYALLENARRWRRAESRTDYARKMAALFAPFSRVAADNPFSAAAQPALSAAELLDVGERNRMIAEPYPQRLVARDQVNQGAALVLTTVETARSLGIPEDKWVYLHGHGDAVEREILDRPDLGAFPAAVHASRSAIEAAGIGLGDIAFFDFYSCFPIAVFSVAIDGLGLSPDDPRGFTVTGGLPYFGGPGNNYSMHAIATLVDKLRAAPGTYGFVGANGGYCSKYSVGIYATKPAIWRERAPSSVSVVAAAPARAQYADGAATLETYTVVFSKGAPSHAIVVGRLEATGERFLANAEDSPTLTRMLDEDPLGARIVVRSLGAGNRFAFTQTELDAHYPRRAPRLRERYDFCRTAVRGHILEVTIARPDARNALHPMANEELAEIFDAFEADTELWIAILTGEGTEAFCAGNDLKYTASGKPMWIPKTGFGGLTSRRERDKPVIAAVNGWAAGGGFEIALACDLIVADEAAQFGLTEVKVGLIAGAGGLVRLPRQLPKKLAAEYILTGKRMSAEEARSRGLVNRVTPKGAALEGARALAEEILAGSPTSVRLSLRAMRLGEAVGDPVDAIDAAESVIDELLTSEDMHEGPLAFAQKRKPYWKNR